jgi:hypothetical protein
MCAGMATCKELLLAGVLRWDSRYGSYVWRVMLLLLVTGQALGRRVRRYVGPLLGRMDGLRWVGRIWAVLLLLLN